MLPAGQDNTRLHGARRGVVRRHPLFALLLCGLLGVHGGASDLAHAAASPLQLKQEALTALEQISTTDKKLQRIIAKAIENISRSLSDKGQPLFLDEFRIVPPSKGNKVFERERKAIERLRKGIKRRNTPEEIKTVFHEVIDALVEADRQITGLSLSTAQRLVQVGQGNPKKVDKAQREFDKALGETDPRKAISRFEKAWALSQKAAGDKELVIATFQDAPDPFSPSVATTNTLTATLAGRRTAADDDDDDDDRDEVRRPMVVEFQEFIQDAAGATVRTITTRHEVLVPPKAPKKRKERSFELTVTSAWDGLDGGGNVVPDGTYSYLAFGKVLSVKGPKPPHRKHRHGKHREDDDHDDDKQNDREDDKEKERAMAFPVLGTIVLDDRPPMITAAVTPAPNANGWHMTDVTVGFTAADALSGLASVTPPVVVSTEGADQVITGTATDQAGNSATTSVTINLDKTSPVVTAPDDTTLAAVDASGTPLNLPASQAFLSGASALDNLAGVLTPTNDAPLVFPLGPTPVTFSATDPAGNVGLAVATVRVEDQTPPVVTAPGDITVDINNTASAPGSAPEILAFLTDAIAMDNVDGEIAASHDAPGSFPLGSTVITFTATDVAGNTGSATATVTVQDLTAPVITIANPADLGLFNISPITVTGTIDDPTATVAVNGVAAPVSAGVFEAQGVALEEGTHPVTATATDLAGNQAQASINVRLLIPPVVTITQPTNLKVLNQDAVTVSGTVDDPAATVAVNRVPATTNGGTFTAANVLLREGNNVLTAAATDAVGTVGTASIQVTRDSTPPMVTIDSPSDGFVTESAQVTVTGMINDIVVGTVNGDQAQVTVNGVTAQVANRSFLAADVSLRLGANTIIATGTDKVGNASTASITVFRLEVIAQPNISIVSGNNQTAPIGSQLQEQLVVKLSDGLGNPVTDKTVIFKVTENNGTLNGGNGSSRSVAVTSDDEGLAQAQWTLGTRAGAGNNVAEAGAVAFAGKATFVAVAQTASADKINVDAGNNQTGVVGQPLPKLLVAVVTDAGHNRLANVPVTFTALEGGGHFNAQSSFTVNTDSDGRALAVFVLGPQEGIDNNLVEANFPGNLGFPASFVASGKPAGDPEATAISGVVLDNTDRPIEGVTMRIQGTTLATTQTDAQGQFRIQPAPVGDVILIANGSTAQRPGVWPSLEYELVTIAGQDNTIGMPIYLLPLDVPKGLFVDETTGGTLTLPQVPGFSLTITPGSATFPDGSRDGTVSVTVVHADKIPMTPNFGQQPRFIVTIQPAGVLFDPPAPITLPNTDGLAPGEVTELYSFDHDMGQFVAIGTGTVSEDGAVIRSDPGVGIIKGGWHCGGNPATTGAAEPAHITSVKLDDVETRQITLAVGDVISVSVIAGPRPESDTLPLTIESLTPEVAGVGLGTFVVIPCGQQCGAEVEGIGGTIIAKEPGTAFLVITYTCKDGATARAGVTVTVEEEPEPEEVHVEIRPRPVFVCVGDPFTFRAIAGPEPGTYTWSAPGGSPSSETEEALGSSPDIPSTFASIFFELDPQTVTVEFLSHDSGESAQDSVQVDALPKTQDTGREKQLRIPTGIGPVPTGIPFLSDAEFALVTLHPAAAVDVYNAKDVVEFEVDLRFRDFPGGALDGTRANAFKHAGWAYLLAKSIGPDLAKQFLDAHENFFGNPCADVPTGKSKAMDLNNNQAGLNLATDPATSGLSRQEALDLLEHMAKNGELFHIK